MIFCLDCDKEVLDEGSSPLKSVFAGENPKKSNGEVKIVSVKGTIGLKNLGNTCYMNAAVQCLSNVRSFQRYFRKTLDVEELRFNEKPDCEMIGAFSELLKEMWKGDAYQTTPKPFLEQLKSSCTFFKGGGQHDSQEFLRIFLDRLHENVKFESSDGKFRSIVSDSFSSTLQTKVTCTNCGSFIIKDEDYYDLSVSIPSPADLENYKAYSNEVLNVNERVSYYSEKYSLWSKIQQIFTENKNVATIYDCLLNFCLPEELKDQFHCKTCMEKTLSRREVKVLKPPNSLMIVVKRFKFNKVGSKISTFVQFPVNLDLRYFLLRNTSCQYQLTGLIQHIGGVNGGHYVSYAKNYKNNIWYEFDDSRTRQITELQLLEKEAYILFYQRQIPEMREKFRTGEINALLPSYWENLYYTVADPGTICQKYLLCSHGNLHPHLSKSQFTFLNIQQEMEMRNRFHCDSSEIMAVEECEKCLEKAACLNMRMEQELELIEELNNIVPFEGPWYIISNSWLGYWKEFCSYGKGESLAGPIDNQVFFNRDGSIRNGLEAGKDYRAVNRHVWAAFQALYTGGPEIKRLKVDIYLPAPPHLHCSSPALSPENISKINSILAYHT